MMIIFITTILTVQNADCWSYFRLLQKKTLDRILTSVSVRNPKSYGEFMSSPKGIFNIPRVPSRRRGLEHKDDGRSKDWTFDQQRSRQAQAGYWKPYQNYYKVKTIIYNHKITAVAGDSSQNISPMEFLMENLVTLDLQRFMTSRFGNLMKIFPDLTSWYLDNRVRSLIPECDDKRRTWRCGHLPQERRLPDVGNI